VAGRNMPYLKIDEGIGIKKNASRGSQAARHWLLEKFDIP